MNNICIVGAGKIAYSLTKALLDARYNVCSVLSRTMKSAERLALEFNLPLYTNKVSEIPAASALFFLAVPDSEIENVSKSLSFADLHFEDTIFVHLSGAQDISSLKALKDKGASVASLHIMQTFPSNKIVDLTDHYAAIETDADDDNTSQFLFSLARKLHMKPFSISSEKKALYHLTGVFASNFLVANIFNASLIFGKSNIPEVSFGEIAKPIIESTLNNIEKNGINGSLSGPVARGDLETIRKHVDLLKSEVKDGRTEDNAESILLVSYLVNSLTLLNVVRTQNNSLSEKQEEISKYLALKLKEEILKIKF